jgi:hypothetical protein
VCRAAVKYTAIPNTTPLIFPNEPVSSGVTTMLTPTIVAISNIAGFSGVTGRHSPHAHHWITNSIGSASSIHAIFSSGNITIGGIARTRIQSHRRKNSL